MIALVFGAFNALSGVGKLIAVISILLTLGGLYAGWYAHVYNKGYGAAIAAIARQDAKAIRRATAARSAVTDCASRNLVWDQSTGQCSGR
jgi:hypothetical protein